ncbi:probable kinetochore protein Nuf2p [[Candida] railenensis]|uniref:Probable kinetochore protein Nuf2p n=1 Tax=[Candida] railenensis TaxID=45579 RepID=A0A9P0QLB8_9ASCO|nr:probable kinetochore protein Nuf2p [[Candida] railenensis]
MSRYSSIYRPTPASYRRGAAPSTEPHYLPGDNFPYLESREISISLQDCGFTAIEENVIKPTSKYMRKILEETLEVFMGVNTDMIANMVNEKKKERSVNAEQSFAEGNGSTSNEDVDEDTTDSLLLVILYRCAFQFFVGVGIRDLTLSDILKPDPARTRRILSALINYIKFRNEQSVDQEPLEKECEAEFTRMKKAQANNDSLTSKINQFKRKLEQDTSNDSASKRASLRQITTYNTKLTTELKKLKRTQEYLNNELTKYKNEKFRLTEKIDDSDYLINEADRELATLRSYLQTDVKQTETIIADLKKDLSNHRDLISQLAKQNSNLSFTIESFLKVESEIKPIFNQLDDTLKDLTREESTLSKLEKLNEYKSELQLETNELTNQIDLIEKKLANQQSLIERLEKQQDSKLQQDQSKVKELTDELAELNREREEFEAALTLRNATIEEYKLKIKLKRKELEDDEREVELNLAKLNSHVKFYLSEMSKKLESSV